MNIDRDRLQTAVIAKEISKRNGGSLSTFGNIQRSYPNYL
jgi:hypothetical protein